MWQSLWRLRHVIGRYRYRLGVGIVAFGIARGFEIMVPIFMAQGINRIAEGNYDITGPVLSMLGAVVARYIVVTFARYSVRRSGLDVSFDLRGRLFSALQQQGGHLFFEIINALRLGDTFLFT